VVWQHVSDDYVPASTGGEWMAWAAHFSGIGGTGVVAFFCISGFVISSSLRGPRKSALRNFTLSRFLRLYPMYWVSIPLGVYTSWTIFDHSISLEDVLKNVSMLPSYLGAPRVMGLYWSLEVELAFYLACAALYSYFGHLGLRVTMGASVFFSALHLSGFPEVARSYYFLSLMFFVASLRNYMGETPAVRETVKKQLPGLGLLVLAPPVVAAVRAVLQPENAFYHRFGIGSLLGIALFFGFLNWPMTNNWPARIGLYTYSIYLLHPVIFKPVLKLWGQGYIPSMRLEVFVLLNFFLTVLVSVITFRLIEKPCIELGKRLRQP